MIAINTVNNLTKATRNGDIYHLPQMNIAENCLIICFND